MHLTRQSECGRSYLGRLAPSTNDKPPLASAFRRPVSRCLPNRPQPRIHCVDIEASRVEYAAHPTSVVLVLLMGLALESYQEFGIAADQARTDVASRVGMPCKKQSSHGQAEVGPSMIARTISSVPST